LPAIPEEHGNPTASGSLIDNPVPAFQHFIAYESPEPDIISIGSDQEDEEDEEDEGDEEDEEDEEDSSAGGDEDAVNSENDDIEEQLIRQPKVVEKATKRPGPKAKSLKRKKHQDDSTDEVQNSQSDDDSVWQHLQHIRQPKKKKPGPKPKSSKERESQTQHHDADSESDDDSVWQRLQHIRQPKVVGKKKPGPKPKPSKRGESQTQHDDADSDSDSHDPRTCGEFYF
jgi:hypothetical protein